MSHPDYAHIGHTTDLITEECAELIQAVAKARRFGLFGFHPETLVSNIDHIRAEMGDVERQIVRLRLWLDEKQAAQIAKELAKESDQHGTS